MSRLLVVAGEGSGDGFAAPVVRRLGVEAFGLGGAHLETAGVELVGDLRAWASMGLSAAVLRAPRVAFAVTKLMRAVWAERPRAALLVGFSEVNAHLAGRLSARGTRVLWYAPPQVWAWRTGRAAALARRAETFAVVLPFEAPVWRRAGAPAEYVGHPVLEAPVPSWNPTSEEPRIAVLPGSRRHEIRAHAPLLLEAARRIVKTRGRGEITVVRAASLDPATSAELARHATWARAQVTDAPIARAIAGHHVALVGSGTATLECTALAVPAVIVYRTDPVTYAVGKRVVRVPHIGLPNLVLGRRAFPELVQYAATPGSVATAALSLLESREEALASCRDVRTALEAGLDPRTPSARVADLLTPLLG
jgi:lipid-A-disaccharide synthase